MVESAMNPAAALVGPPSLHVQVIRHISAMPLCSFAGSSRLRWQDDSIGHSSSGVSRRGSARWRLRPSAAAADAGADYERRVGSCSACQCASSRRYVRSLSVRIAAQPR